MVLAGRTRIHCAGRGLAPQVGEEDSRKQHAKDDPAAEVRSMHREPSMSDWMSQWCELGKMENVVGSNRLRRFCALIGGLVGAT